MLKKWLEAVEEEDQIVLTSLRLAGRKRAKRLEKRHEELLDRQVAIVKEIEMVGQAYEKSKTNG